MKQPLGTFHVRNFKAITDTGLLKFTLLTVLVGNNGSGKSSLVEALETFRDIVLLGVDAAMDRWRGIEYIWNRAVRHELEENLADRRTYCTNPLTFRLGARIADAKIAAVQEVTLGPGGNDLFILREIEDVTRGGSRERRVRDADGWSRRDPSAKPVTQFEQGASMLKGLFYDWLSDWQFLRLAPEAIGEPHRQQRAASKIRLWRDGSNVAEYLNEIRRLDLDAFEGILEALRFVLPYAVDLQPALTSELEAVRENLLALSDDIWRSIDHNDPQALEEGVDFKRRYNDKMAGFDRLAGELSEIVQGFTSIRLQETERGGTDSHDENERIVRELDREQPHTIDEDFTFRRPHGFVLDGQAATGITTWRRLYELFCQQLARRDPERFRALPSNALFVSRRGHCEFNTNRDELRSPMLIAEGIYAEINHSANALRDQMRDLLGEFRIERDRLRIYLREDRDAERERG